MNTTLIDNEFGKYICATGMYKQMGITRAHQLLLRYQVRKGIPISLDKKLKLLQLAGWKSDDHKYTQKDLVLLTKFVINASANARQLGAEYLVEKFLNQPNVL